MFSMLKIRPEQFQALEAYSQWSFVEEMLGHSREFASALSQQLCEAQLRVALAQAIKRAKSYGFTNRGPIRLYIELMFLCGSDFDTDPQYPEIGEALRADYDQMSRAEHIRLRVKAYMDEVAGPGNTNVRKALEAVSVFARNPHEYSASDFEAGMVHDMTTTFPQKTAYIGEARVRELIGEAKAEAARYQFTTPRGMTLLAILMFSFGHGCLNDPLYPWMSQTLSDERIVDASARAGRLERKSITWLGHVLARPLPGTQP
jgi:hypothetical protein